MVKPAKNAIGYEVKKDLDAKKVTLDMSNSNKLHAQFVELMELKSAPMMTCLANNGIQDVF